MSLQAEWWDPAAAVEFLARYRLGDLTLVDCRCGPCDGHRGRSQPAATDEDTVGVLFVRAGEELVEIDGECVIVRPGSALVWRSSEQVRFRVPGPLHEWMLLVPAARLPPSGARLLEGAAVGLLTALLGTTMRAGGTLEERLCLPVADAAVDLLRGALTPEGPAADPGAATWLRITAHVHQHLSDPHLTPERMAAAGFVSVRSMYALFAARGETPAGHVRRRRLEAARRELERTGTRSTVAEVAHRWGFRDQATFSRAFRSRFGRTPDEVRRGRDPEPARGVRGPTSDRPMQSTVASRAGAPMEA
jgi:AraC-like DNA-binding protein